MSEFTAVDIETTGLSFVRDEILGIGIKDKFFTQGFSTLPEKCVYQNGHFDIKFLKKRAEYFDWLGTYAFDTLLASSVLINRPESLALDSLAAHYLDMPSWKDATNKMFKEKNWVAKLRENPERFQALADRNIADLNVTSQLVPVLLNNLKREHIDEFFFDKVMPAARMLTATEYRGMRIDLAAVEEAKNRTEIKIAELKNQLNAWAAPVEINWNSPKQLLPFLRSKGYNLWAYDFKKKATVESTGTEVLSKLKDSPNIALLLEYRGANKLMGYLEGWLEEQHEGRLYPSYNMASTRTGRLSASNPNVQQIPRTKEIRALFIPSEGRKFVIGDFSQIEVRVAAHYSKDPTLLKVFEDNLDFYGSIAVNVLGVDAHPNEIKTKFPKERFVAKVIGLSILYGIGGDKLSTMIEKGAGIKIPAPECKKIIREYFKAYPGLLEFRNYVEKKVMNGEILRTHYGRQFKIDPDKVFSTGVNTVVQSTASDACLFSQLEVDSRLAKLGIEAPLVAIIHDEVIRECLPEHAATVGRLMEEVMCNQGFICPLKLDWAVGDNWGDKK